MAKFVYLMCAMTSLGCAITLIRAYFLNRTQLLFWSGLCFIGFASNNIVLFVDLMLGPAYDLSLLRSILALGSISLLLYGLVWEAV